MLKHKHDENHKDLEEYRLLSKVTILHGHEQANSHLVSPQAWLKNISVHPNTLTMIGWITVGRVHLKSSARKVTHQITVQVLGGLTLEFPWDPGEGLGFKPPFPC